MRARRAWALVVMAACGGGKAATFDAPPPDTSPPDAGPVGAVHTYAMDDILLPTQASQSGLGLDLDGDGKIDNALGKLLTAATDAASGNLDLQQTEDDAITAQTVIDLVELQATDLTTAVDAGLTEYEGAPATGGGVEVAASSPTDGSMLGAISSGLFTGGPGRATLTVILFDSAPITLTLYGAEASLFDPSSTAIGVSVLAGGITQDDLNGVLIPAIYAGISGRFAQDCTVGGAPPGCGCVAGSTGQTEAGLFDQAPQDCTISLDEVKNNQLIGPLLVPDVQLRTAPGQPPTPCFSVGVSFTAKAASFAP